VACRPRNRRSTQADEHRGGHKRADRDHSPRIIDETRQYIREVDRLAATTTTAREFYDEVLALQAADDGRASVARHRPARAG
jgi:hypothetical protein